jgi:hypothetical protein
LLDEGDDLVDPAGDTLDDLAVARQCRLDGHLLYLLKRAKVCFQAFIVMLFSPGSLDQCIRANILEEKIP